MSALKASIDASQAGFDPRQFDAGGISLAAWFDPRDHTNYTLTSGRVVDLVNKVSGVSVVEVGGNGPTFATTLNGGPCMLGDGASKYLRSTEAAILDCWDDNAGDQLHTLAWLYEHTTGAPFSVGNSGDAFDNSSWVGTGYQRSQGGTSSWAAADPLPAGVNAVCIRYRGSALDPTITFNQIHQTVNVQAAKLIASPNQFVILAIARSTLASYFEGKLGPVLIWRGNLSDAEVLTANRGLKGWYGA